MFLIVKNKDQRRYTLKNHMYMIRKIDKWMDGWMDRQMDRQCGL